MHRVGLWAEEDELGGVRLAQSGAGGAPWGGPQPQSVFLLCPWEYHLPPMWAER